MLQTTLVLLKPDCVAKKFCGEILSRFERRGYTIRALKVLRMDDTLLREHYAQLVNEPYFPPLADFMLSGPIVAAVIAGEEAIQVIRGLIGPTDSRTAAAGTIRGDMGTDNRRNMIHASDSPESAAIEIRRFFKPDELVEH